MKLKRFILTILLSLIAVVTISYFCIGNYFYEYAMKRSEKAFMENNPDLPKQEDVYKKYDYIKSQEEWVNSTEKQELIINSFDNLKLAGTIFKNNSDKWIILVHGYTGSQERVYDRAQAFHEAGFNVLTVDCRGCGKSEGNYMTMGWFDRLDILAWTEKVKEISPGSKVALYGVSMGGSAVMMASGEKLPDNVKVIIEDCGYNTVKEIFTYQLKLQYNLSPFPVINALDAVTKIRGKFSISEASSAKQLKKNKLPILFIHGTKDTFVPVKHVYEVLNVTTTEKDLYIVNGAPHNHCFSSDPETYISRCLEFISKFLN